MVGAAVLGHGTLAIHQEAIPAAFLRQGCLVSLSDEGVQLSLLTADGLHKLIENAQWQEDMGIIYNGDTLPTDLYSKKKSYFFCLFVLYA